MEANWFLALPIPAGDWFEERVATHPPLCVRLFHPDDLHLTVAFLGRVGTEAAARAWNLRSLWTQGPVPVTLSEVIGMGPPERFSALSALLEGGREVVEAGMHACRDPMLAAAGAPPERHAIKAHVTLARPRRDATQAQRSTALAWAMHLELRGVALECDELALYTWDEQRRDRQFRIVERRSL